MKVFGHPMSTCTRKVLTTLAEKEHKAEFVLVDLMTGAHKSPEHMARQPFGVVPALDDDGFVLFESRAIIAYLAAKLPGKALTPGDIKSQALVNQWMSVEYSYFTPSAMKIIYEGLFAPMAGREPDQAKIDDGRKGLETPLTVLDKRLGEVEYVAGDFSIADICFMPYVEYLFASKAGDLITDRKNVAAWWNRVSERPSWQIASGKKTAA